ncbi:MAG TPA: MBG domain-containing protein, partial [Mucilaginibacter sp.]
MRKFLRVVFIVLLFAFPARVFAGITFGGSLSAFSTTYGTASASQSFTVTASESLFTDPYTNFFVLAPNGFELSLDGSNYSSSVSIPVTLNFPLIVVPNTTVYIRLAATTGAGTYFGNVTATEYFFTISTNSATLAIPSSTVNPYPITITANTAHKTYGQTLTTTSNSTGYTITSGTLQNAESMGSVTIAYGSGAAATDAVGSYPNTITPSAATGGTFNPSNYTITYAKGNLIVDKAAITIKANNVNKTYGTALTGGSGSAAFTVTSGTLPNSETIGSVTIAYGSGTAATAAAGSYPNTITPSAATGGTFNANNYTISYTNGDLTVDKAAITIKANNVNKTYGTALTGGSGSTAYSITSGSLKNSDVIDGITIA